MKPILWSELEKSNSHYEKNYISHGSCVDVVFFSNCEFYKSGKVYSTVSDQEMVYALIGDDSLKHNAKIRVRTMETSKILKNQPERYFFKKLSTKRISELFFFPSEAWLAN